MAQLNTPAVPAPAPQAEPAARIFRRTLLRIALVCGVGVAALAWSVPSVLSLLVLVPPLAIAIAATAARAGQQFQEAALMTVRVCLACIAVAGVISLAGLAGILLAGLCLGISDTFRSQARRVLIEARRSI